MFTEFDPKLDQSQMESDDMWFWESDGAGNVEDISDKMSDTIPDGMDLWDWSAGRPADMNCDWYVRATADIIAPADTTPADWYVRVASADIIPADITRAEIIP